jgi:isopentenyl-diphosphate delta-isomerase
MINGPELIDVLDKNGRPTGEQKTKLQIFDGRDYRNVVHVWLINSEGQLLVQQRAHKGLWDDLWDVSVGGGVSAGEEPAYSGVRELEEELGVKIKESEFIKLGVWETSKPLPEMNKKTYEFSHTFLLKKDIDLSKLTLEPKEVVQVKYMQLNELKNVVNNKEQYKKWVPHPQQYYKQVIAKITEKRPEFFEGKK